jgi:hypothetical protein
MAIGDMAAVVSTSTGVKYARRATTTDTVQVMVATAVASGDTVYVGTDGKLNKWDFSYVPTTTTVTWPLAIVAMAVGSEAILDTTTNPHHYRLATTTDIATLKIQVAEAIAAGEPAIIGADMKLYKYVATSVPVTYPSTGTTTVPMMYMTSVALTSGSRAYLDTTIWQFKLSTDTTRTDTMEVGMNIDAHKLAFIADGKIYEFTTSYQPEQKRFTTSAQLNDAICQADSNLFCKG